MLRFPTAPGQVTTQWLAAALERSLGGALPRLEGFACAEIGTGQVGRCVRFELRWADADDCRAPSSVVAKFPSSDPASRAAARAQNCYRYEVGFYRHVQQTVAVRTPTCHVAEIDDSETGFVLLLEDLAPARAGDQIAGCSADVAREAMRQMAALHARWWGDSSLDELDWLSATDAARAMAVTELYRRVLPSFVDRFGGVLSPRAVGICSAVGEVLPELLEANRAERETVVHRDFRIDNLLIDDDGKVAVVDWQTVGRAGGAGDAAYFVGASLVPELRRELERELFGLWYDELRERGVEGLAEDRLWREYRLAALSGVVMSVISAMIVGATERGDRMFTVMTERHSSHAYELASLDLLSR